MKLRLVSRLMVLTLVVVVGVIIIIHERAATTGVSHTARPTPTSMYAPPAGIATGGAMGNIVLESVED